jgi:hypothetical protein
MQWALQPNAYGGVCVLSRKGAGCCESGSTMGP